MNNKLIYCESVCGSTHKRKNFINQDYGVANIYRDHCVLVVSDGHGSNEYFRSHIGSKIATDVTIELFNDLSTHYSDYDKIVEKNVSEILKINIVKSWKKLVFNHYLNHKLTNCEKQFTTDSNQSPYEFYGATLLGVLLLSDYMVVVQIGDGNILTLLEDGKVVEYIEKNSALFANQTTSLCDSNAIENLNVVIVKLEKRPILITLMTDGIINSFTNSSDFYSIPHEILAEINYSNFINTCNNLKLLLEDMATKGSGDDCTISLLYDPNIKLKRKDDEHGIKKIRS